MKFFRLVKPVWGMPEKANGKPNPKFVEEILGPNVIEGVDFDQEFLTTKNKAGFSIYHFPNHPSTNPYTREVRFLNGKLIDDFQYAFCDIDFKDEVYSSVEEVRIKLEAFPLKPTYTVSTGHGYHIFFKISNLVRESFVALQLRLIEHFDSDTSVYTCLQLMRCPGFANTKKHDEDVYCEYDQTPNDANIYTAQQLLAVLPELTPKAKEKGRTHLLRLDGKIGVSLSRDVDLSELPDRFIQLMHDNPRLAQMYDDPKAYTGDRSITDMSLCHILYTKGFDLNEAMAVIANTKKAQEKGPSRFEYASLTVGKVFHRRKENNFQSVSEYLSGVDEIQEPLIHGPTWIDSAVLGEPWRRKEILGIISGAGMGKTALTLNIILQTMKQDPSNKDVYVFIALDSMTRGQVIKRWVNMVGRTSPYADRLYVVDTEDAEGKRRPKGLQEIYSVCMEIKRHTGRHIKMLIIDHIHVISSHIDVRVEPDFGIRSEGDAGHGNIRNLTPNQVATQLDTLSGMLDTFLIILAQTTKEKAIGDIPLFKDACYGISQFEWICTRVLTLWQPLLRVLRDTDLRVTAFQYAKIREIHEDDRVQVCEPKLLTYDVAAGMLRGTGPSEYQEFLRMLPAANEARKNAAKNEGQSYSVV